MRRWRARSVLRNSLLVGLLSFGAAACPPTPDPGAAQRLHYDIAYDFVRVSIARGLPATGARAASPPQPWRGRQSVMAMSRSASADFAACYYPVAAVTEPRPQGRVGFAFTIEPAGTVAAARVTSSVLANARVEGCVLDRIRAWRFAPPVEAGAATAVDVTLPLIFRLE